MADLTVGRLSTVQLAEFRALAQASVAWLDDGRLVDPAEYVAASVRFNAFVRVLGAETDRQPRPAGGLRAAQHR